MAGERPRPHRDLTPAAFQDLHKAYQGSVQKLEEWGVRIPAASRIHEAAEVLQEMSTRNDLGGESDEGLGRVTAAVALVVDFFHITDSLGEDSHPQVAAELAELLRGALGRETGSNADAFLSQFWIGTLLAQSGLKPRILATSKEGHTRPDFVIESGSLEFAVEVKRPRGRRAINRIAGDAARQLKDRKEPGFIVLDLTDALGLDPFEVVRGRMPLRRRAGEALDQAHRSVLKHIDGYSRSDKFDRVSLVLSLARFWSWNMGESTKRDAGLHFRCNVRDGACRGLVTRPSESVQDALLEGVRQLTGNDPRYSYR